jgi:hypothetical protein
MPYKLWSTILTEIKGQKTTNINKRQDKWALLCTAGVSVNWHDLYDFNVHSFHIAITVGEIVQKYVCNDVHCTLFIVMRN